MTRVEGMDADPPTKYFFHGTKASFKAGEVVLPRREHWSMASKAPLTPGGERHVAADEYVYVTSRFYLAWAYAHASGGEGDPVILNVWPEGDVEPDPEHTATSHAYRCRSAKVRFVDDKPAISAEVAAQHWKQPADLEVLSIFVVKPIKASME